MGQSATSRNTGQLALDFSPSTPLNPRPSLPEFSNDLRSERVELRGPHLKIINYLLAHNHNQGIVLATSLGKTVMDMLFMSAVWFREDSVGKKRSRFLIIVPTVNLAKQFHADFFSFTRLTEKQVQMLADTDPLARQHTYQQDPLVVISTPQGIEHDFRSGQLDQDFFDVVIFDEAHHGTGSDSYVQVATQLDATIRIIAQTATVGSKDAQAHVQTNLQLAEWRRVSLFDEFNWLMPVCRREVPVEFTGYWEETWNSLSELYLGYKKELHRLLTELDPNQRLMNNTESILSFANQRKLGEAIDQLSGDNQIELRFWLAKMRHVSEIMRRLYEESYDSAFRYSLNLRNSKRESAARSVRNASPVYSAMHTAWLMKREGSLHPKHAKAIEIIEQRPEAKVIVYFEHVEPLKDFLAILKQRKISAGVLVGKDNRELRNAFPNSLDDFESGSVRVLLTSSVGQEGIHLPYATTGIVMEPFKSSRALIQFVGRFGRERWDDEIYFLLFSPVGMTKYFSALAQANTMNSNIEEIPDAYAPPAAAHIRLSNLPRRKDERFLVKNLHKLTEKPMIRSRFKVTNVRVRDLGNGKRRVVLMLRDNSGGITAEIFITRQTPEKLIEYYLSLEGKVCLVSGQVELDHSYVQTIGEVVFFVRIVPIPDRQNVVEFLGEYDPDDYENVK